MTDAVKVRICVAITKSGRWSAASWLIGTAPSDDDIKESCACALEEDCAYRWVTAEIPLPEEPEIEGKVE